MRNLYVLLISSISGFSTILGNILLFVDKKYKDNIISFAMGLSFIVMFLISIIELLPDGIELIYYRFNIFRVFIFSLFLLIIGYCLVFIIEKNINNEDNLYKIGILSMLSLFIHNVPEGMICALTTSNNFVLGLRMCFIILIHNIPEGICISLPIYYSTGSRGKAFLMTFVSSLGELFGAIISILFLNNYVNDFILGIVLIITAGIMISLSVGKILIEGIKMRRFKWLSIGVLVGVGIILLTL